MTALAEILARYDLRRIQHAVKWSVYTLLLINFGFYIAEDWQRARLMLTADATFFDWAAEFATSIDLAAWFILLAMFELETYVFEDDNWSGWVEHTVHGVRIVCFLMIAHTVFAYGTALIEYSATTPVEDATSVCDLADEGVSWSFNLAYTEIDRDNCDTFGAAGPLYWLGEEPAVTDGEGLALARTLAVIDVIEAVSWLIIILAIEIVVRLQGRGVTGGPVVRAANGVKLSLYLLLFGFAAYWASLSHWLYAWDEFLWIAGFAAIDFNVREWRDEMLQTGAGAN